MRHTDTSRAEHNAQAVGLLSASTVLSGVAGLLLSPVLPLSWWQCGMVGTGVGVSLFVLIGVVGWLKG